MCVCVCVLVCVCVCVCVCVDEGEVEGEGVGAVAQLVNIQSGCATEHHSFKNITCEHFFVCSSAVAQHASAVRQQARPRRDCTVKYR